MDSRLRGNDEYTKSRVIPAEAGIQRLGTVTDHPDLLRSYSEFTRFLNPAFSGI